MLNVVCSEPLWQRYRRVGRNAAGMVIRGRVEHADGVTNLVADRLRAAGRGAAAGRAPCCPPGTARGTSDRCRDQPFGVGFRGLPQSNASWLEPSPRPTLTRRVVQRT